MNELIGPELPAGEVAGGEAETPSASAPLTWTGPSRLGDWELTRGTERLGGVHYWGYEFPPTYSWDAVYRWNGMPSVRGEGLTSPESAMRVCEEYVRGWIARGEPYPEEPNVSTRG